MKMKFLWICMGLSFWSGCLWENHVSRGQGGGGTEGVAVEVPDSVVSFEYRTWMPLTDSTWSAASQTRTWHRGEVLDVPKGAALEMKSKPQGWIAFVRAQQRLGAKALSLGSWMVPYVQRQVYVAADSLVLDGTPYGAKCVDSLCTLREVPSTLLDLKVYSQESAYQVRMQDTVWQQMMIPGPRTELLPANPSFIWSVHPNVDPKQAVIHWSVGLYADGPGFHADTSLASDLFVVHGLDQDAANGAVDQYSVVMDLKNDSGFASIPLQMGCTNGEEPLLSIDSQGYLSDYMHRHRSGIRVIPGQWHRLVYTVDLRAKEVEVWVDGWRIWSFGVDVPQASSCSPEQWALYQNAARDGQAMFFRSSASYKVSMAIQQLAIYQGIINPELIARLGGALN